MNQRRLTIQNSLAATVAFCVVGCSAGSKVSHTVDKSLVAALPAEGKRIVYEAENNVIIALDRFDTAEERLNDSKRDLQTAKEKHKKAKKRTSLHAAKEKWLSALVEENEKERRRAEKSITCNYANLELAKAQAVVRFDLPAPEDFQKKFASQKKNCEKKLEKRAADLETQKSVSLKTKLEWLAAQRETAKKTGDHNHGIWID